MADLRTTYLGLELAHPVVASASPISKSLDGIRRLAIRAGLLIAVQHPLPADPVD